MKNTLNFLFEENILTREKAKEVVGQIASGTYSDAEIASFLTVFAMRPITPEELAGFRDAFIDVCISVDLSDFNTIDVCGTGGDEKNTFNISTLTAFVLAGAGVKVVKHGNYAVSSACGSSNIFEHFGYKFSNEQDKLKKEIETANICYFHAPIFHPAMKHVGPVRKALKVKTVFNMLGPIVNPAQPQNQMIGVFNEDVMKLYSDVCKINNINHSIIYSLDGYDEISLTGDFKCSTDGKEDVISPESMGLKKTTQEELFGGDTVEESAKTFFSILEGNGTEAQENVVVANAAIGLKTMNREKSIEECVDLSRKSMKDKKALSIFTRLMEMQ